MAKNAFGTKTDSQLLTIGEQVETVTTGDGPYGLSAAQTTALAAANNALGTAITAKQAARDASKAATQQANEARQLLLSALGSIGATIYNNPTLNSAQIAAAGYAVHDDSITKHAPTQPVGLSVTPDAYGTVLVTFEANGNVYPTIYIVEGRGSEAEEWSTIITSTRRRVSVSGFAVGETYWFRVRASRNEITSIPSNVAAIWEPEAVTDLEVAA